MKVVVDALSEIFGLFVEDGSFAAATVTLLAFVIFVLPRLPIPSHWRAALLLAGVLVVLVENVIRSARKARMASAKS